MLSTQDNDRVSRVGPGTPMGALMREYWLPALLSSELPQADSDPVRIRLLGENLIAFRQTDGTVGLVQNACPHRRASLFYGRNEENGLRCVYHGWKFDVDGRCVDMPSEPAESNFKDKIRITAYPTHELHGVVWTYMGPRATPPPMQNLEPLAAPAVQVQLALRECNWLQGLEGDIDTSHLGFLHLGSVDVEDTAPGTFDRYTVADRTPRYNVIDAEFGTMYGAYRPAEPDTTYWRFACFMFPFYTIIPTGVLGVKVNVRAWVPIDDENMMFWSFTPAAAPTSRTASRPVAGDQRGFDYHPNTTDWLGRWRLKQDKTNDYLIDRAAQRTASYTGITGIHQQDQAITESMGALVDRSQEHLGTSDMMIIRTRQRLLKAADAFREGAPAPGVDTPDVFAVRGGGVLLPNGADWLEATAHLREAYVEHPTIRAEVEAGRYGRF